MELKIYNLYSIQLGVKKMCNINGKGDHWFPSIVQLKEVIEWKNKSSLKMLANTNWILSL